jgi:hypothetical protein
MSDGLAFLRDLGTSLGRAYVHFFFFVSLGLGLGSAYCRHGILLRERGVAVY